MNESISFHILRLLETPGIGPAKVSAVLAFARENHADLTALLEKPSELKGLLTAKQIEELSSNIERISTLYTTIRLKGVKLIATGKPSYPEKLQTLLGPKAPPLLMVLGNELLLEKPAVGFCGSRKASEKGLATGGIVRTNWPMRVSTSFPDMPPAWIWQPIARHWNAAAPRY